MDHIPVVCSDLLQDLTALIVMALFLGAAVYGSAGVSALVIAWRVGQ